jgi:hypothetical protein
MDDQNQRVINVKGETTLQRRRRIIYLLGFGFLMPLAACGKGSKMRNFAVLDVEMFSYIDHVIIDIIFDGTDLGVMNRFGGTGVIAGVRIPFGIQTLTWVLDGPEGTPRIGEHVTIKNTLTISDGQIPPRAAYIGLHLYPDDTAEVTFSEGVPEKTIRGKEILATRT